MATSGALAGLGGLGAFFAANPALAGAVGSGLGKTIATGDLGEGLKTGLISGVTGTLLQGLTSGGDFIRSAESIGGADALAAARAADATANVVPSIDAADSALALQAGPGGDLIYGSGSTGSLEALDLARAANPAGYAPDASITTRLPTSSSLGVGEFAGQSAKDIGTIDRILEPPRPLM